LTGIPEVRPGDDLAVLLEQSLNAQDLPLRDGDALVLCQKIVSKSEGRIVALDQVQPSARALELAQRCGKEPALVELVLRESTQVLRCVPDVLIVRHRLGFVVANAAIDQSNVVDGESHALLLPVDPDASAQRLRRDLQTRLGVNVAVLINDSFGRAWREGVTGTCIGCAGFHPLADRRGQRDRQGRVLKVTQVAAADELAAAASLLMGQGSEGIPAILVRGLSPNHLQAPGSARQLVRLAERDLFQ
jgi:coenzyme F420-0:L-glutamate ligase/coenzyme F420-1:gamma-L-glutamate ligase